MRLLVLLLLPSLVWGQNSQTGDLNTATIDSTVDSNNATEQVTNNYNGSGSSGGIPVNSAIAPSYMSNGQESCLRAVSGSVQSTVVGLAAGRFRVDEDCNRRKYAKLLKEFGMTVAAVSLLCQDGTVWRAMFDAGTPCPIAIRGRLVVGKQAFLRMKQNPETFVLDYRKDKDHFNTVLGIGQKDEEVNTDSRSISELYRSSRRDAEPNAGESVDQ